jgi:dipeptidyl aminopeptidase/acylaminoacyl peptidase
MSCDAPECSGEYIDALWWSADGDDVLFWNLDRQTGAEQALYSWTPSSGSVSELVHASSDVFIACEIAVEKLLCLRETGTQPRHVAAIDTRTGTITVVADVNSELKNIQFGRIERIEWTVPNIVPNLYPPRAYGYILYPPDFDPARKYPVFIAPYGAWGFHRGDIGDEHPLFVYAAHGIVVLHTTFPSENPQNMTDKDLMKLLFSSERGYPYFTTMMESTLAALDLVVKRGFVDEKRVGIGGLSQGSQNPLYMLAKSNRIAAASVAGGYMGSWLYYAQTPRGQPRSEEWYPAPVGEGWKWWASIDVAQQANKITAPILFNFSDQEVFNSTTLMRHLEDAHKPFDAYVFPGEYHEKWQPSHRAAIYSRNLDWFRFWLKGEEDPDSAKAEQYKRWRDLLKLQKENEKKAQTVH